ncbi:MAG TPA: hypothetical protein VL171_02255 [Verrucomicrobiae bacterium]|nr:hypothetical protein [Verrucomicrobiae bacterium]
MNAPLDLKRFLKPFPEYDWMHPSWRDLVIEHLQSSRADRRRFLSRCGVQGILLALSSAGGGTGVRETPLLVEDADWKTFEGTIIALLNASRNESEVRMVLGAIHGAALRKCKVEELRFLRVPSPLREMAIKSLETLRAKWNGESQIIGTSTLAEYYNISVRVTPLPGMPNLQPTWDYRLAEVEKFTGKGDSSAVLDKLSNALWRWFDLIEVVESSEPRFLRQMGFPELYLNTVREYLDRLEEDANSDFDFDSSDDYGTEIERMAELEPIIEQLGSVFPSLEDRAQTVREALASAQENLRDAQNEKFPEAPDDYEGRSSSTQPTGGFDVDELFADL